MNRLRTRRSISCSLPSWRRRSCQLLAGSIAVTAIAIGTVAPAAQAMDWSRVILNGIQFVQLSNLSDKQDVALGKQMNEQMLESGEFRLSRSSRLANYVDSIGQRLTQNSDRSDLPFTFQVVQDDAINAFATTGGYVYMTTGSLEAADNDDQVAAVLAHEIAHITQRHVLKQLQQTMLAQAGASALGVDDSRVVGVAVELALRRPHSREAEYEADEVGLELMHRSGYDPQGMPDFLSKLLSESSPPQFLSTHPATRERIDRINSLIEQNDWAALPSRQSSTRVAVASPTQRLQPRSPEGAEQRLDSLQFFEQLFRQLQQQ
jgi:predicted Zn-dependent protease